MTRLCRYCNHPFSTGPQALRRTYCYAEACAAARDQDRRAYKAAFDERHRTEEVAPAPAPAPATPVRAHREGRGRRRTCLSCNTPFGSRGPEHRICRACKHSESWRSALASHTALYW